MGERLAIQGTHKKKKLLSDRLLNRYILKLLPENLLFSQLSKRSTTMYKFQLKFFLAISLFLFSCSNPHIKIQREQVNYSKESIEIIQVREDKFYGNPEGKTAPPHISIPVDDFSKIVIDGVYKSPYNGIEITIPSVFKSNRISIYQGLVSKRTDGTPITSHVLFISQQDASIAGLVVTRLREDRPKDANSILRTFKPKSEQEYQALKKNGILYKSYQGKHGEILEREVKNRIYTWLFPYRIHTDSAFKMKSLGISRFYVVGDYFYEFTVLLPKSSAVQKGESFHAVAQRQLDLLTAGIIKYAD